MGVTNAAKALFANLILGSGTAITHIAVGSGTTAFAAAQTALVTEITDSGVARTTPTLSRITTTVTNDTMQATKTFTVTGTITVAEGGLFNDSSAGDMPVRVVFSPSRSLVSGDTLTYTHTIVNA